MTKLEAIQTIGDIIVEIDTVRGSLPASDSRQQGLSDARDLLDQCQLQLSRQAFDENSQAFQDAAGVLAAVNREIKGTVARVDAIATTIGNIARFVTAATSLVASVAPLTRPARS